MGNDHQKSVGSRKIEGVQVRRVVPCRRTADPCRGFRHSLGLIKGHQRTATADSHEYHLLESSAFQKTHPYRDIQQHVLVNAIPVIGKITVVVSKSGKADFCQSRQEAISPSVAPRMHFQKGGLGQGLFRRVQDALGGAPILGLQGDHLLLDGCILQRNGLVLLGKQ